MALFNFRKKELKKLSFEVQRLQSAVLTDFINNNARLIAVYPSWDIADYSTKYTTVDDIYSIIRLLATTAAGIPMYGYLKKPDKKAFTDLQRETKSLSNPFKLKKLQTKALEDLPEDDPLAQLIENPNEDMSKFEFLEAVYSFLFGAGEVFLHKQRPDFGANAGKVVQLNIMFPECVIPKVTDTLPRKIVAYDYRINGRMVFENIPARDIIHIKYWNPNITYNGDELRGLSPIKVLKTRLTRLKSNMDVSVAQLQNGGKRTIIYDEDNGGTEGAEIVGNRSTNFYKFSSNPANTGMAYFAAGKLGAVQIGSDLADMDVDLLAKTDFKKVCNVWTVSDRLFNNDATGSEISDTGARKGLYNNAVLPNVRRVKDALIRGLVDDFKNGFTLENEDGTENTIKGDGKDRYIDIDISGITELHEDVAKKVAQYANLPIMIPNMILEEMGFPTIEDDPLMEKVYVKTGYQLLDDLQPVDPIDVTNESGN